MPAIPTPAPEPGTPAPAVSTLNALSPLDGRYAARSAPLATLFSEGALFRQRLRVEVEWLCRLAAVGLPELPPLEPQDEDFLRALPRQFDAAAGARVKELEARLNHDVKAVEYYLKERMAERPGLHAATEFAHFGCTSEDINNLAYALSLEEARTGVLLPSMEQLHDELCAKAEAWADLPMLARTHGQPASPTTLGKEIAVFAHRLERQRDGFKGICARGKLNGAVGNYNALQSACPELDWPRISRDFVAGLGLEWNPCTTQIEPHDWIAEYCHALARCAGVLLDLCRDLWGYVALGCFRQQPHTLEVGSSTMPHKVNPIHFENAEGNLELARSLLEHLARTLPVSRWQRDLSDSTTLRNLGTALGHFLLACESCREGMRRITPDLQALQADLEQSWEVLAEAVQTVMRRHGLEQPYERLKELTRGTRIDQAALHHFIRTLELPPAARDRLLQLTPAAYTGNAADQARAVGGRPRSG